MKWIIMILIVMLIICMIRLVRMRKDIRALNRSLGHIQENNTNQQLTTTTFYKDICSLSNTMNKILEKYTQIRIASEKSNREFHQAITNISHDLRTPLTSAIGYLQMIQSGKIAEDKKAEYLRIIEYRLKVLSDLTDNLLEYSRLIEAAGPIEFEKINVNNLLRNTISTFYDQFIEQEYQVIIDIPDQVLYARGDEASFERIFMNLIQNALRYGTQVFEVSLDVKAAKLKFRNKIADPQGFDVKQILDRFYTADDSRSNKSVGLGLAIVKELVSKMGGSTRAYLIEDCLCIEIQLAEIENKASIM